jgi:prolyl oligopeptidase
MTDPYLWLEELHSDRSMAWVRDRNAEAVARLAGTDRYAQLRDGIRAVLDAPGRIPVPYWHDGLLYHHWEDREHPRGLWRRTTLAAYRTGQPAWEVLIDVDELAAREGESWVFQSVAFLRPAGTRCLVSLSRGGSDACVVREFDLSTRDFVTDGFTLPEAKSSVEWIDADRIYVGTDFGPGSLTSSGYPRIVKEWRRGTPLSDATTVFEAQPEDVVAYAIHHASPGYERDIVRRYLDFYHCEHLLRTPTGELVPILVPPDAELSVHREWLLIQLRSGWDAGGTSHPAGTVLLTRFDDFLAGGRDLSVVFAPDPRTALDSYSWTRDHLILTTLVDVRSRQEVVTLGGPRPAHARLATPPGHTIVAATNAADTDEYLLVSTDFTEPDTLWYGRVGAGLDAVHREPAFFDSTGISVRQFFARSDDGTRIPYFTVGRASEPPGPTLLTGYGGFGISRTPSYDGVIGRGWLARGGTYAVANIRGGGEYGPDWHHAALRENRPRAYQDFAAIAADLVARGITTPAQLGAFGRSNGGLLMGVMLTRYPERFGAIVSEVPLLDLRRYHKLLAGASWMAEYGDPDDESDWAYLQRFSPYHNVAPGRGYPPVLFVTSTRDDRVHAGHARKMAARLREYGYHVTYYENIEGGHAGAADNEQRAVKWALVLEYLWQHLGASHSPSIQ